MGYHDNDYSPIDHTSHWYNADDRFEAVAATGDNIHDARNDLWNGNIGTMVTALYAPPEAL